LVILISSVKALEGDELFLFALYLSFCHFRKESNF